MDIEINTANGPDGQPIVVMRFGETVTMLHLNDANYIGYALINAVAKSVIKEPIEDKNEN